MQKRPNLAYIPQVSVLLVGIQPDLRPFYDAQQARFIASWLPIAPFVVLECDGFFRYLCWQDKKRYRPAKRQISNFN